MKQLIISLLVPFLFACTGNNDLHAILVSVNDREMHFPDEMGEDSLNSYTVRRIISPCYLVVNELSDTIFVPIDNLLKSPLTANVLHSDSLLTEFILEGCTRADGQMQGKYEINHYAPNDTFFINLSIMINPKNDVDNEWLKSVSTKELVSKMQIKMKSQEVGTGTCMIPDIIFSNDTGKIVINPVIGGTKGDTITDIPQWQ